MAGFGGYDDDDVRVKGDDGTDGGALISAKTDGSDKRLTVDSKLRGSGGDVIGNIGDALKTTTAFADESLVDAFGRLRVSVPTIKWDAYFVEDERPLTMTKKEVTGGTVTRDATRKEMHMAVTTSSGSRAAYQSKEYIHYIPGQSSALEVSVRMDAGTANCIQRVGLFDDDNGLFFELDGTTLYTVIRSSVSGSVVDTRTVQASWSADILDGSGASGLTLDITKHQIFYLDYQWLGAGRVRFGLNIEGTTIIVDERTHANSVTSIYMQTGSLPVRCEVVNSGAIASAKTLRWACASVYNEGSLDSAVSQHSVNRGTDTVNVGSSSFEPLISLRLKAAHKRATIIPKSVSALSTSNTDILWEIVINPVLTGASWVSAGDGSIGEYDISGTAATGGEILASGYIAKQSSESPRIEQRAVRLTADFDGVVDIVTVRAKTLASNANILASLGFLELF